MTLPFMMETWPAPEVVASPGATSSSSPSLSTFSATTPSADPYGNVPTVSNQTLISPPSPSRHPLQPAGLRAEPGHFIPPPSPTLYSHQYPSHFQQHQNVLPVPINASSSRDPLDNYNSHGSNRTVSYPSHQTHNVSINSPYHRPRTSSHPVFHSTSALAAHHGIPQSLPPVPRTSKFAPAPSTASHQPPAPAVPSTSSSDFDFSSLCSNYLNMLSQKSDETQSVPERTNTSPDADAVQAIMDAIQASPEFRMAQDFNDFLTSPMEDSPFEDFLTTPAIGNADVDMLTSPAIFDDDSFDMGDVSLFSGDSLGLSGASVPAKSTSAHLPPAHPPFNFDELLTMSPTSPSLDPSSLHPSPYVAPAATPLTPNRRLRKNQPTGTRKNITPDALVPLDAPIQSRKYVTPSSTSRKEVPNAWLKKRARSQAFGEEDELEDDLTIDQGDLNAIDAKRRQNTLAARRSRKRKLEYQRTLESSVEREKEEKEMWKQRAMLFKALLESHGHEVPSLESV